ncbi:MAG: hypothetical protein ABIJ57_01315 [Pseudomonadota bacterium]
MRYKGNEKHRRETESRSKKTEAGKKEKGEEMTLAEDMVADLGVFYDENDFAVSATLTVGAVVTTISVIFSAPFRGISPATGEIETTAPEARCKTSDVSTAVHGSTLVIGGVTYNVIGKQPGEDGIETILVLSKD